VSLLAAGLLSRHRVSRRSRRQTPGVATPRPDALRVRRQGHRAGLESSRESVANHGLRPAPLEPLPPTPAHSGRRPLLLGVYSFVTRSQCFVALLIIPARSRSLPLGDTCLPWMQHRDYCVELGGSHIAV